MAEIIIFSNLKGGVGKSTLCCHIAHQLASRGLNVAVLDADPQLTIAEQRQRELATNPDIDVPWKVYQISGNSNIQAILDKVKSTDGYILVDCPGSVTDPSLLPVFKAATSVVIPMRYDDFVVGSTIKFVKILKKYTDAKLMFLPNCIDTRIKNPSEQSIKDMLSKIGNVLPRVKQGVAIQRVSTLQQDEYQRKAVMFTVDDLLTYIKHK